MTVFAGLYLIGVSAAFVMGMMFEHRHLPKRDRRGRFAKRWARAALVTPAKAA